MKLPPQREPDFIIGPKESPYLRRWWVIPRNRFFNIYLHQFLQSDDDRALHDHPWFNVSYLLFGRYREHRIAAGGVESVHERQSGGWQRIVFRSPWTAHRVEMYPDEECWTVFITGPVMRSWGFHCPKGWRHWRDFVDARDTGKVGRGCG